MLKEEEINSIARDFKNNPESVKLFLEKYGYNFKQVGEIELLGAGGESMVFRVEPF